MPDLIGMTFPNGYVVERLLGQGGMGAVYLARHAIIGTRAVIKVLLAEFASNAVTTARFVQEAIAGARVEHDNIVKVHAISTLPDGRHYIELEFLEGRDLEAYVEDRGGRIGEHDALTIILQVCCGLNAAHVAGVVHRDLKPPNIFITSDSKRELFPKILDFGIAKLRTSGGRVPNALLTGAGAEGAMGTPAYMAPEQALAPRTVDQRADIYALGCIMYRILAGHEPFTGETIQALFDAKRMQRPARLSAMHPNIGPRWDAVISRCLAPDADDRYHDVLSLVTDLVSEDGETPAIEGARQLRDDLWPDFGKLAGPADATVRAPTTSTPTSLSGAAGVRAASTQAVSRRSTARIVLGLVVAASAATAIAIAARSGGPAPAQSASQTPVTTIDAAAASNSAASMAPSPPDARPTPDAPPVDAAVDAGVDAAQPPAAAPDAAPPVRVRPKPPRTTPELPKPPPPPKRRKPIDPDGVI